MLSQTAADAQALASHIEVGDKIKIIRTDLTDVTFEVVAVSDEGISGDGVFVAYSDIWQVQVRQHSTGKTVGLVAAIAVGLTIAIAARNFSPGPGFSKARF